MNWKQWLEKWGMTSLKINAPYLEMEFKPQDNDRNAAWELYVEMLTRITTQSLKDEHGDEQTALKSIHSLFDTTRTILKKYPPNPNILQISQKTFGKILFPNNREIKNNKQTDCTEFSKIAIVVLNQVVRPFTAKWHKLSLENCFADMGKCQTFRKELADLQIELRKYTKMLADMAGVEDLTDLENNN